MKIKVSRLFYNPKLSVATHVLMYVLLTIAAWAYAERFFEKLPLVVAPHGAYIQSTAKWNSYQKRTAAEGQLPQKLLDLIDAQQGVDAVQQLQNVRDAVFSYILPSGDPEAYGKGDYWAAPGEAIEVGAGDCDEYATLSYQVLRRLGHDVVVVSLNLFNSVDAGHAVAFVQLNGTVYVLDNEEEQVLPLSEWWAFSKPVMSSYLNENGNHLVYWKWRDARSVTW